MEKPIAIIGAGPAGLACARTLEASGRKAVLLDKGRATGGRLATRRAEALGRKLQFDHGAQYVRARDPDFTAALRALVAAGQVAEWAIENDTRFVGAPGMSALGRALADGLAITTNVTVTRLTRVDADWQVHDAAGGVHGPFAAVVVATPAPQAVPLLAPHAPRLAEAADATVVAPCWALMAAFDAKLAAVPDVLRPKDHAVAWVARDSAKPGRANGTECLVVHAAPEFSRTRLEWDAAAVAPELLAALESLVCALPAPIHLAAHRWRYALVETPLGAPFLHDAAIGLAACGDWCLGPRVESAWLSGVALGRAMLT